MNDGREITRLMWLLVRDVVGIARLWWLLVSVDSRKIWLGCLVKVWHAADVCHWSRGRRSSYGHGLVVVIIVVQGLVCRLLDDW